MEGRRETAGLREPSIKGGKEGGREGGRGRGRGRESESESESERESESESEREKETRDFVYVDALGRRRIGCGGGASAHGRGRVLDAGQRRANGRETQRGSLGIELSRGHRQLKAGTQRDFQIGTHREF